MCRRVLLVVLWLLIGTRLLVVGLLSIPESLCPSQCLFGTILVTHVFDGVGLAGFKRRANAFLLAWSALSLLLHLFYLFLPSMGWLCGVGVFGLIECSHSHPTLHCGLQLIIIIIIIIIITFSQHCIKIRSSKVVVFLCYIYFFCFYWILSR